MHSTQHAACVGGHNRMQVHEGGLACPPCKTRVGPTEPPLPPTPKTAAAAAAAAAADLRASVARCLSSSTVSTSSDVPHTPRITALPALLSRVSTLSRSIGLLAAERLTSLFLSLGSVPTASAEGPVPELEGT